MKLRRGIVAVTSCALILVSAGGALAETEGITGQTSATADKSVVRLSAFEGERALRAQNAGARPEERLFEYRRGLACQPPGPAGLQDQAATLTDTELNGPCAGPTVPLNDCAGDPPVMPLWRHTRTAVTAEWEPYVYAAPGGCPGELLPQLSAADFRVLPIAPSTIQVQPDRGWVLVNMDTIVLTDPAEQTFRTTLLGYGVDVVATPTQFTWDFGDGAQHLTTTSPGHAYPNQDVVHAYRELGTAAVTLTTTWSGRYRVDGDDDWHDVVGTAQTTSTAAPFEIVERRSHLVAKDCNEDPRQVGC